MRSAISLAILALALGPVTGRGQATQEVRGRVIDADGRPVAGQTVLLHRVVGQTGANLAQAHSDSTGRFVIAVDSAADPTAVYFLAARWQGELYIGDPFQAPLAATERILQVGVPGTSASALLEGTAPATPTQGSVGAGSRAPLQPLFYIVPIVILLGLVAYLVLRNRALVPERRQLLARVARLDLEREEGTDPGYDEQRARLMRRLRELSGG